MVRRSSPPGSICRRTPRTRLIRCKKDATQRAQVIQRDSTLSRDARTHQLAALVTEAQTKITAAPGAGGYAAYQQYGGQWLRRLRSWTTPPPKT